VWASLTVVPLIMEERKGLWTLGSFTGSLTLLLLTCCIYTGGDWFAVAMIPILFSLSVLFAPFVIAQIPLKGFASTNKGLLAMIVDTVLLFAVVIVSGLYGGYGADFWQNGLIITSISLLFPWVLFLIIRYLKANAFVRAGLSVVFSGIFLSVIESMIDFILYGKFRIKFANEANLLVWNANTIDSNVTLLILISGFVIGGVLLIVGLLRKKR